MKRFAKEVAYSLNPLKIVEMREASFKTSAAYAFQFLLFCFLLAAILSVPKIVSLSDYMQAQLGTFEEFSVDVTVNQSQPLIITPSRPLLVVDTRNDSLRPNGKELLVTNKELHLSRLGKTWSYDFNKFKDVLSHKKEFSKIIVAIILLMLPSLIVVFYLVFLLKYLLLVLFAWIIGMIVTSFQKKPLGMSEVLNCAIYALTPMVLVDIISSPFVNLYFLPFLLFVGYFIYSLVAPKPKGGFVEL